VVDYRKSKFLSAISNSYQHPYSVNIYGGDHSTVREQHAMMWQNSRPKVMHACMEAYHEASISPRPNTGLEYRQNTIQALGCGNRLDFAIHSYHPTQE